MNKQEFIEKLRARLSGLSQSDVEERISFYCEMIEDRMEEGLSEEEAVRAIGNVDEIAEQIVAEKPQVFPEIEEPAPKRKIKTWEIVLIAVCSPIWVSLAVAAVAVAIALFATLWAVVVSLWATFGGLIGGALGGVIGGTVFICGGKNITGVVVITAGIVCAGLAIFLFFGCKALTKGAVWVVKESFNAIGKRFEKREVA